MTEKTFFSPWLKDLKKFSNVWEQITTILRNHNKNFELIPAANDIWVRDFMPIQRHDGKLIVYAYRPDYLEGDKGRYITDCREALTSIKKDDSLAPRGVIETDLVIDGGNALTRTENGVS